MKTLSALLFAALALGLSATVSPAQPTGKKATPIKIKAEDLAKECAASSSKAEAKYKDKTLRVTGKVGDIYDDILYLPVKVKGSEVLVGIRYGKGNKPAVKKGDEATFDGKFDRVAVLGPALVECKLVPKTDEKKK